MPPVTKKTPDSTRSDRAGGTTTNPPRSPEKESNATDAEPGAKSTYRKSREGYISPALATLKALFKQHYYFTDDNVIDVVLGVVAGNHFDSDPIWLHIIGPPSSGKTELLYSIQTCDETFFLSDFTANSLISGYRDEDERKRRKKKQEQKSEADDTEQPEEQPETAGEAAEQEEEPEKDYSLLPKLDGKVLVTKDFSLIHDKPAETRAQILSILRDVYDGYASRALGNSDAKGYRARFNYLTGMTPDIEKSWSLNTLGERFLMYRIEVGDRRAHARRALKNVLTGKGSVGVREELQAAVKVFMDSVERVKPTVSDEMMEKIIDLADILSTCRTYVHRERNDDMVGLPLPELASRVGKQLLRVGQSVASVRGRKEVTEAEFEVMKRIALDSLPTNRRHLLAALWEKRAKPEGLETFAKLVSRIAKTTVRRELDNLSELGAVESKNIQVAVGSGKKKEDGTAKVTTTTKTFYRLAETFRRYCENVKGIPSPRDLRKVESAAAKGGAA